MTWRLLFRVCVWGGWGDGIHSSSPWTTFLHRLCWELGVPHILGMVQLDYQQTIFNFACETRVKLIFDIRVKRVCKRLSPMKLRNTLSCCWLSSSFQRVLLLVLHMHYYIISTGMMLRVLLWCDCVNKWTTKWRGRRPSACMVVIGGNGTSQRQVIGRRHLVTFSYMNILRLLNTSSLECKCIRGCRIHLFNIAHGCDHMNSCRFVFDIPKQHNTQEVIYSKSTKRYCYVLRNR